MNSDKQIAVHSAPADYECMRQAGRVSADMLDELSELMERAITTEAIDEDCHKSITKAGEMPAALEYREYPRWVATSVWSYLRLKDTRLSELPLKVADGKYENGEREISNGDPQASLREVQA